MTDFKETVWTMIRARYSVIWLVTHEEERAVRMLADIADNPNPGKLNASKKGLMVWSFSQGFRERKDGKFVQMDAEGNDRDPIAALEIVNERATKDKGEERGTIFVLHDLHRFFNDQSPVYRFVRDTSAALKRSFSTVVITAPVSNLPVELEKDVAVLNMPLPTVEELKPVLTAILDGVKGEVKALENGELEAVLKGGLGLTEDEFSSVIRESLVRQKAVDPKEIVRAKEQLIRKSGVVDFYQAVEGLEDVGGLATLKTWLLRSKTTFTDKAAKYGIKPPKGVFLTGPPGTGKSLTVKAAASMLGVPLLWVKPDQMFSKYVGESEQRVRRILDLADAVAPAILFIDEVEKVLAGSSSGQASGDSGVTRRVFGSVLTWMAEHTSPVLVMVTANDPLSIPPEFMSRFNKVFFVDIPDLDERREITKIHLEKVGRKAADFNVEQIAKEANGFSGREIERAVQDALGAAFADGEREVTTLDVLRAFSPPIRPLAETRKREIEEMRTWAQINAVPANYRAPETAKEAPVEI